MLFIARDDGRRVRIPPTVEQAGADAIAAFLVDPPAEAICPQEPEPIPAEQRTTAPAAAPTTTTTPPATVRRGRATPTAEES